MRNIEMHYNWIKTSVECRRVRVYIAFIRCGDPNFIIKYFNIYFTRLCDLCAAAFFPFIFSRLNIWQNGFVCLFAACNIFFLYARPRRFSWCFCIHAAMKSSFLHCHQSFVVCRWRKCAVGC